jgi:hypothetical protein
MLASAVIRAAELLAALLMTGTAALAGDRR